MTPACMMRGREVKDVGTVRWGGVTGSQGSLNTALQSPQSSAWSPGQLWVTNGRQHVQRGCAAHRVMPVPGGMKWERKILHHAAQNIAQFKAYKLFISEIVHLLYLDHGWLSVTETVESKIAGKGELLYMNYVLHFLPKICNILNSENSSVNHLRDCEPLNDLYFPFRLKPVFSNCLWPIGRKKLHYKSEQMCTHISETKVIPTLHV